MDTKDLLIVGVGNPERGDDGVGSAVVRQLDNFLHSYIGCKEIDVIESWGEATSLVSTMDGWKTVVFVDAAMSGADPGTFRRIDASEGQLPADLAEVSSHGFGLAQAVELARALEALPDRCIIYAIEGKSFEAGDPLSPEVADAAKAVVAEIIQSITNNRPEADDEKRHA